MSKMVIFDPATCCCGGVGGIDPETSRVTTIINNLEKKSIKVERYDLTSNPQAFITNSVISDLIKEEGVDILPVTVVDDKVVKTGSYPTNEEFCAFLGIPEDYIIKNYKTINRGKKPGGCCCK